MADNAFEYMPIMWNGYELISSEHCTERVQARRHKKRRINKKWRKRYGMKCVPRKQIYVDTKNKKIFGHPIVMDRVIAELLAKEG